MFYHTKYNELLVGGCKMSDKEMRIITNNPWIEKGAAVPHDIVMAEGTPIDTLDKTEEYLQNGWKLVSTPLPPNIPIMRGPYRSLVVEKNDRQYDKDGLIALEKARERYIFERKDHILPEPSEDFGIIDRQMLQRTLRDAMLIDAADDESK